MSVHQLWQLLVSVASSGVTRGARGTSAPGRSTLERQTEVGMLRTKYEMSNVS